MIDLPAFSLDAGWFHLPEQARRPADLAAGRPLPDLHRLPPERPLFLARLFSVPPIGEVCLRYLLHVGYCPADMALTINRQHFDSLPPAPLELDITDHIWLEDNLLALTLPGPGPLRELRLLASPCEQF